MRSSPLSLLLVLATPAFAQDEIVVTGRGLSDPAGDAAYGVVTVDGTRLTATASGRLEDALKDVAGVQQFRRSDARSANPTSQGVTLRGLGGNAAARVLVLLDGVPQGDPFAGYVSWPAYLPERLARVRVTRGGGSGAGGNGALAGTVELDSIGSGDGVDASIGGGSFGAVEARVLVPARLGAGFGLIAAGYARGDGFQPIANPGPADRGARYDQGSFAARGVFPAFGGELQANLALFDDIRTRGTDFTRNRTTGSDASLRYVSRRLELLGYVQVRRFTSQFASLDAARAVVTPTLDQFNTPATGLGLKVEYRPQVGPTELRFGGEWRHTGGETNELFAFQSGVATRLRKAGGTSDIVGGFAEATHSFGALTLTGGGRIDRWWIRGGRLDERALAGGTPAVTAYPDRSGWAATARAGMAFAATPRLSLRGAAYLGWRLPTLNELYRPFRVGIELTNANTALSPERSRGFEAGMRWQPLDGLNLSLTAFSAVLDDAIANVTLTTTPTLVTRQRRNLDRIVSRGVEADVKWVMGDWRFGASLSFADAKNRAPGSALDGLRPAGSAPFQTSATFGWRGLSTTLRYVSAQFDDDLNARRLKPAVTVDAVADLPIGRGIALRGRIENLFDAQIQAAVSATGVVERAGPRAIWLGVRFQR